MLCPLRSASTWGMAATIPDRKSTRLNSSHLVISYAVFCLKKKTSFCRLQDDFGGGREIFRHPVGAAVAGHFVKDGPNADRADAGVVSAFSVDLLVADQTGMPKIDIVVAGRFKNHPRRRLPAF